VTVGVDLPEKHEKQSMLYCTCDMAIWLFFIFYYWQFRIFDI